MLFLYRHHLRLLARPSGATAFESLPGTAESKLRATACEVVAILAMAPRQLARDEA
jgi:hypothetical protein